MKPKPIEIPPEEEHVEEVIDGIAVVGPREMLAEFASIIEQQRAAVALAKPALDRLINNVLTQRSGQCYKMRDLLYSLWNGQPVTLSHICGLDYELRADLCAVFQAWGYGRDEWEFFYRALETRVRAAGQWDWFLEAGKEEET